MERMSGEALVTAAALVAVQVAQGRTLEEISVLAAFFTCLGDNLAMIAVQMPEYPAGQEGYSQEKKKGEKTS